MTSTAESVFNRYIAIGQEYLELWNVMLVPKACSQCRTGRALQAWWYFTCKSSTLAVTSLH